MKTLTRARYRKAPLPEGFVETPTRRRTTRKSVAPTTTDSSAEDELDLDVDPKLAWALNHREQFPIDVNRAPRELLLRIPGVGVRTVDRILQTRRHRSLSAADMRKLRVPWRRVQFFVQTKDHTPRSTELDSEQLRARLVIGPAKRQLDLFAAAQSAHSGEL